MGENTGIPLVTDIPAVSCHWLLKCLPRLQMPSSINVRGHVSSTAEIRNEGPESPKARPGRPSWFAAKLVLGAGFLVLDSCLQGVKVGHAD